MKKIMLLTVLLSLWNSSLFADTNQTDIDAIKSEPIRLSYGYYTANQNTADGKLRWYISATGGALAGYIFSLGEIETINGVERVSWREVSSSGASVNLVDEKNVVGNIADNPSHTFKDWGLGVTKTNPTIQEDIELIRNSTVDIRWWFFQAPNNSWYIIDKSDHIYKFDTKNGEYDWQIVDTTGFDMEFYMSGGNKMIRPLVPPILTDSLLSVSEDATTDDLLIGSVTVDYDGGRAVTSMTLSGVGSSNFNIDETGAIRVKAGANLDYESVTEYNLTAYATNSVGDGERVSVHIAVTNVSDTVATLAPSTIDIQNHRAAGSVVGNVTIVDSGDSAISGMRLSGVNATDFTIANNGVLTTTVEMNASDVAEYNLTAIATNVAGDSQAVDVNITVENLFNIVPLLADSTLWVEENVTIGQKVGEVTISNIGDSPISAITLSGTGNENFAVSTDGNISIKAGASLDYESRSEYNLTAIATNTAGDSGSVKVDIGITNVVDLVPLLATPTAINISENISVGSTVLTVELNGTLSDQNVTDSFSIVGGDDNHDFNISDTGVITTLKTLNAGVKSNYILVVYAENRAGESTTISAIITVTSLSPILADETAQVYESGIEIEPLAFSNTGGSVTSCSSTPTLPAGLSVDVNESSCQITGKPSYILANNTYTITASNTQGEDNATIEIMVKKELPLLIIQIEYNDKQFENDVATWNSKIYGDNESELNHYYTEISYGSFKFKEAIESQGTQNDGIITVRLDKNHPDPRGDATKLAEFKADDLNASIVAADDFIDFSTYDKDGNGKISVDELQIMFLVAGGESAAGTNPGVWAHASGYGSNAPINDGVKLMSYGDNGRYSMFGERHGSHDATIGIIAHELGHAVFKLPDLYDISGVSEGIGKFGLMGSGNWAYKEGESYGGQTPVHMTGWSKSKIGFTTPTVIENNVTDLEIKGTSSIDYKVMKVETGRDGEYFLLENRAATGYDRGFHALEGAGSYVGGLSILHIDDNQNDNRDVDHKLVDVEEANNAGLDSKEDRGHYNNLFFSGNSDSFTATSTPNSKRYDENSSGVTITNISDAGDTMTADININDN